MPRAGFETTIPVFEQFKTICDLENFLLITVKHINDHRSIYTLKIVTNM